MKKVFLSLAALTFITASSLSVTSCGGSDDKPNNGGGDNGGGNNGGGDNGGGNNGGGDNGGGTTTGAGKITYNGQEYKLDSSYFTVYGENNTPTLYKPVIGGDTVRSTAWRVISWEGGFDDVQSSLNYVVTTFFVPVAQTNEGLSLVYPQDAEVVYAIGSGLYAGNAETPEDLGDFVSGELNFTEVVLPAEGQDKGSIKYTASITKAQGSYNVTFDGDFFGIGMVAPPQSKNSISKFQDTKVPVNFNSRLTAGGKVLLRK